MFYWVYLEDLRAVREDGKKYFAELVVYKP